jgi:hypothetical protein
MELRFGINESIDQDRTFRIRNDKVLMTIYLREYKFESDMAEIAYRKIH